ncbi:hypothetical protein SEA_SEJANUS_29 [Mycobacterium phage Sejanus]|nr:hypothetical protein SEA_SEJANUS_29 [Mycobacterium phage Sejanus]
MPAGPTQYLVNKLLDHALRNVPYTPPAVVYFKAHIGDPGAAGTANASNQTTRIPVTFLAASGGVVLLTGTPEITLNATENISHGSLWDTAGPSGGNCLWTAAATIVKGGVSGDIIRLSGFQLGFTGLAA